MSDLADQMKDFLDYIRNSDSYKVDCRNRLEYSAAKMAMEIKREDSLVSLVLFFGSLSVSATLLASDHGFTVSVAFYPDRSIR